MNSEDWLDLAARDSLEALRTGTTDSDGTLTFSGLTVVLYLVVRDPITIGSCTYTPMSFLISLPNLDEAADKWEYDVTAKVKFNREDNGGGTDTPRHDGGGDRRV